MKKGLIIGMLLTAMSAGAVKMQQGATVVRQSDGTTITVRAFGDEDMSYFMANDGTLLYQTGTNFYIAKVNANGLLEPTDVLAHEPNARGYAEIAAAKKQNRSLFFSSIDRTAKANRAMREPMAEDNTLLPHLGKQKIPVILVEFSDVPFTVNNPKETFNKYLNGKELFNKTNDPEMGYFNSK